jgi:hypothetical protein
MPCKCAYNNRGSINLLFYFVIDTTVKFCLERFPTQPEHSVFFIESYLQFRFNNLWNQPIVTLERFFDGNANKIQFWIYLAQWNFCKPSNWLHTVENRLTVANLLKLAAIKFSCGWLSPTTFLFSKKPRLSDPAVKRFAVYRFSTVYTI